MSGKSGGGLTQLLIALIGAATTIFVALIGAGVIDFKKDKTPTPPLVQPPGSSPADDLKTRYSGLWMNENLSTSAITRIEIWFQADTPMMHWWGKCHPTDCDNGTTSGQWQGDKLSWNTSHQITAWFQGDKLWITINQSSWPNPITESFRK
jgi:hypothetical protein